MCSTFNCYYDKFITCYLYLRVVLYRYNVKIVHSANEFVSYDTLIGTHWLPFDWEQFY